MNTSIHAIERRVVEQPSAFPKVDAVFANVGLVFGLVSLIPDPPGYDSPPVARRSLLELLQLLIREDRRCVGIIGHRTSDFLIGHGVQTLPDERG